MGDDEYTFQKPLSDYYCLLALNSEEGRAGEKEGMREGKKHLGWSIIIFLKKVRNLENCQLSMKYIIPLKHPQKF